MTPSPFQQQHHQHQQHEFLTTSTRSNSNNSSNNNINKYSHIGLLEQPAKEFDQESFGTETTAATLTSLESTSSAAANSNSNSQSRRSSGRRRTSSDKPTMGFGDTNNDAVSDFPDADFNKSLDEAFGSHNNDHNASRGMPSRTKSGRRPRARSPTGDKSVNSAGSAGSGGKGGARATAPARGIARQRSQRRASIAAAVSFMANTGGGGGDMSFTARADAVEEHVTAARAERRIPRRAKHEDRLHAAHMAADPSTGGDFGYGDGGNDTHSDRHSSSRGGGHASSRQLHHSRQDLGYDDSDGGSDDYGYEATHGGGREKRGGRRRKSGVDDEHHQPNEEADRRGRFTGKGHVKSFDEPVRARGRRRASLVGTAPPPQQPPEENMTGLRARRVRRASLVASEGAAAAPARAVEPSRGVRETRSTGRIRRGPLAGGGMQDFPGVGVSGTSLGCGSAEPDSMDGSQDDEMQEWQEKRANKQKDMLERLRKSKEPEPEPEPEIEEEPEPEPEPEPTPKPRSRRRASLGILGMSSSNFSSVADDENKAAKKEEKARKKEEKKNERKRIPARSKSTDGGIAPPAAAVGGRARAADRDRRRPGTMLDRIGT